MSENIESNYEFIGEVNSNDENDLNSEYVFESLKLDSSKKISSKSPDEGLDSLRSRSFSSSRNRGYSTSRNRGIETNDLAIDMFDIKENTNLDPTSENYQINKSQIQATRDLAKLSIIVLVTLGIVAGVLNGLIIAGNASLSFAQATIIAVDAKRGYSTGLFVFMTTTGIFVFIAAYICKHISMRAAGSGLPELKSLLASELKYEESEKLVSKRALFAKIFGLIFATGSCLSVGTEGPLVHTASCIAYFLMKHVYEFQTILQSPTMMRQVYAASTAVGVSSAFNSPVGGLLFSIEVTSTFYLVSNYSKSFIAAVAGCIACNLFLVFEADPLVVLKMVIPDRPFSKWELIIFAFIGYVSGHAAHLFLKVHQKFNVALRPYTKAHPLVTVVAVGMFTALIIYTTKAYSEKSVGVLMLVSDVLGPGKKNEMQEFPKMPREIGLLISIFFRSLLTLLGTNLPVPAGIFMPVFLIGGMFGRFVGHIMINITSGNPGISSSIHLSSYAMVGCVAFSAGVTHTISAAVIAVELTGNLGMLMPCLLAAVIASGITRHKGLSVYDQGMMNKGLDSLQLLLSGPVSLKSASDAMDKEYAGVPMESNVIQLIHIMAESAQDEFPVIEYRSSLPSPHDNSYNLSVSIDDSNSLKEELLDNSYSNKLLSKDNMVALKRGEIRLVGTVLRADIYYYINEIFASYKCEEVLKDLLPFDHEKESRRIKNEQLLEGKRLRRIKFKNYLLDLSDLPVEYLFPGSTSPRLAKDQSEIVHTNDQTPLHETTKRKDSNSSMDENKDQNFTPSPPVVKNDFYSKIFQTLNRLTIGQDKLHPDFVITPVDIREKIIKSLDGNILSEMNQSLNIKEENFFHVNLYPISVTETTPMEHIYIFFEMVRVSSLYVIQDTELKGMITREQLFKKLRLRGEKLVR